MKYILLIVILACTSYSAPVDSPSTRPKTLSIDIPDASIADAIRQIADHFEINVVIPDSLSGRTSVKLRDVTWQQAFKAMLEPVGFTYVQEGDIIKVVSHVPSSPIQEKEKTRWIDGPWYIITAVAGFALVTAVCHFALFIGVLRDSAVRPFGVPRLIWALLVLAGGVMALLVYWIIHHSNLRLHDKPA